MGTTQTHSERLRGSRSGGAILCSWAALHQGWTVGDSEVLVSLFRWFLFGLSQIRLFWEGLYYRILGFMSKSQVRHGTSSIIRVTPRVFVCLFASPKQQVPTSPRFLAAVLIDHDQMQDWDDAYNTLLLDTTCTLDTMSCLPKKQKHWVANDNCLCFDHLVAAFVGRVSRRTSNKHATNTRPANINRKVQRLQRPM